ncbi:hypothetical protein D018_0251 [Vibrio parahaemolyticus VP2007-007]|nr:hypothetical protein D018_0251 [Vibrio parahaemolyticus VP2007-007]
MPAPLEKAGHYKTAQVFSSSNLLRIDFARMKRKVMFKTKLSLAALRVKIANGAESER